MEEFGWRAYAISNPVPSPSLIPALRSSRWLTRDLLRYQTLAENAWRRRKFVARPLGPEWSSKLHPILSISPSRLVVAAGNTLFLYRFNPPTKHHSEAPGITFERMVTFPRDARKDFSGVSFIPDGSEDRTLVVSFANGALGRVQVPRTSQSSRRGDFSVQAPIPTYIREDGRPIRSMSTVESTVLTMDSVGIASLYSLSDPSPNLVSTVNVGMRSPATGWSTHLELQSSSGYAVLGTSSHTPLVVHPITGSGLFPSPQAILLPSKKGSPWITPLSVYSICGATQTFPWTSPSNQIVIAGWYHGIITLHDLRCCTHDGSSGEGPTLDPALTLRDPMMLSPIYSVSNVGARIVAGSAQHSLIHLYDIRSPKLGFSIYLPEPQRGRSASSPVYSCLLEGTRLWAATESRAFVVDFGDGITERTFPALRERGPTRGVGWRAPLYEHDMFITRKA